MQKYVGERLGMGDVLPIYRPVTLSRSPYVVQASPDHPVDDPANQTYWAYWEATPSNKFSRRPAGATLATSSSEE